MVNLSHSIITSFSHLLSTFFNWLYFLHNSSTMITTLYLWWSMGLGGPSSWMPNFWPLCKTTMFKKKWKQRRFQCFVHATFTISKKALYMLASTPNSQHMPSLVSGKFSTFIMKLGVKKPTIVVKLNHNLIKFKFKICKNKHISKLQLCDCMIGITTNFCDTYNNYNK